jgi:hypothetical protein
VNSAGVLAPDAGRGGADGRGEDHAEAQAHDEQGRQDATQVAGGYGELGQVGHRGGAQQHAGPPMLRRHFACMCGITPQVYRRTFSQAGT